jgi:uncharacterized damage-inducible protein DinB
MNTREFRDLLAHMEWADAHTWRSVQEVPAARTDERLRYLLHHLHIVQVVYLQTWRGDPFVVSELASYPDVSSLLEWALPYYPAARAFAAAVDESLFDAPVEFPWARMIEEQFGTVHAATFAESAWQVFSHTTYHRGQIATRVREIGGEPPTVDYLVWVWRGRPAADWTFARG